MPSAGPVACAPFDLARATQPLVVLRFLDDPEDDAREGLNGPRLLSGGFPIGPGDWLQPPPEAALAVERSESVVILAYLDDGDSPICLDGVTVDAAPFSPLALAPSPSALVRVAESGADDPAAGAFAFGAPSTSGEWVVRVTLTFDTEPYPSLQETFFRFRVDAPAPTVAGRATAPVTCARPGESPPRVLLTVDDGPQIAAESGSFSWGTLAGDGGEPLGPLVDARIDADLRVRIQGNVCAALWRIQLAPRPSIDGNQEPITDLVPDTLAGYYTVPPGEANRFQLAPIPQGDWVVQAHLWFGSGPNELIGQTSSYWNVVVR